MEFRCQTCDVLVGRKDAYCDGVICKNGHLVRAAQCDGECGYCEEQTAYQAEQRAWVKVAQHRVGIVRGGRRK